MVHKMTTNDPWLSSYQIIESIGQCGSGTFYLAKHKQNGFLCLLRDFGQDFGRKETGDVVRQIFEDEVRIYKKLHEVGLLRHLDYPTSGNQHVVAIDAESADFVCVHINKEKLHRKMKEMESAAK